MANITVNYGLPATAQYDPGKPVTTGIAGLWTNSIEHLKQWLGASYTAGAVQDHNHDGVNSARIDTGVVPRNGSFEDGLVGWTTAAYTGGTVAADNTHYAHGANCLAITSTVLANGGGEAVSEEYDPVVPGDLYALTYALWASAANISSRIQIVWYDATKAQVSTSNIVDLTNTPTTAGVNGASVTVPAGAFYARIKLVGGVPAAGSAVGTVYFDALARRAQMAQSINQLAIVANSVGQSEIKIASSYHDQAFSINGSVSFYVSPGGNYLLGGAPRVAWTGGAGTDYAGSGLGTHGGWTSDGSTTGGTITVGVGHGSGYTSYAWLAGNNAGDTARGYLYYIQASPPYFDFGGLCGKFMFVVVDKSGNIRRVWVAPEAPWHNNGPTDLRPHGYDRGAPFQIVLDLPFALKDAESDPAKREQAIDAMVNNRTKRQYIDSAMQRADMPLIPHPFVDVGADETVVLIDPVSDLCHHTSTLEDMSAHANEADKFILGDALKDGHIVLDNTPLQNRGTPTGVQMVSAKWKKTA